MKTLEKHTTIEAVKADPDFASSLELPAINLYLIYRGGEKVEYYVFLNDPTPTLLFHGDDFRPSPLNSIDGMEAIMDLLGFLTVQPGDTDRDYFKNYTKAQMDWACSSECEHLSALVSDWEQGYEKEYFERAFKYGK